MDAQASTLRCLAEWFTPPFQVDEATIEIHKEILEHNLSQTQLEKRYS